MPDSPLDLKLLGTCLLLRDGEPLQGPVAQRHPVALLAMLASAPDRTLSRGKLAGLLWREASETRARNRLSTHVHRLRSALGEDVLESLGDDLRLNLGVLRCDACRFEEAIELYERARDIDPMNHELIFQSWWAYGLLRRYDEAAAVLERVLELAPDHRGAQYYLAKLPLLRTGDASAVGPAARDDWEVRWRLGDLSEELEAGWRAPLLALEPRRQLLRARVLAARGDSGAARAALESARAALEERVARDSASDDLARLGHAHARLGDREAALAAAHRALERAVPREGVLALSWKRHALAVVQTLVGEYEDAIATLETYLSEPGLRSFRCLFTHPVLSRLRSHPRFRELERRFAS